MLNKVILMGRLGADPEVRYLPSGDAITSVSLATSRRWRDRHTGERKEETEWHRIVFFGNLAKIAGEYLKKGSRAYVEGRIRTQKWQGQDGQDRYRTEIVADVMHLLDSRSGGAAHDSDTAAPHPAHHDSRPAPAGGVPGSAPASFDDFDDDIPF